MEASLYDKETGKPLDKSYLELDLPPMLQESLDLYKKRYQRYITDDSYSEFDMDWCEFNADIGAAEAGDAITSEQAWYLREKYLGMERI